MFLCVSNFVLTYCIHNSSLLQSQLVQRAKGVSFHLGKGGLKCSLCYYYKEVAKCSSLIRYCSSESED